MKRRAETRQGTQGGSTATGPLTQVLGPLVAGMTATRQSLLEWVHAVGLLALDAVFHEEAAALAGPKGRHAPGRTHHHWGRTGRDLTFGGRRLSVSCPRVRSTEGREVTLPSVAVFRARDPLTTRVMDQLLLRVSARGYARSLEGRPGA